VSKKPTEAPSDAPQEHPKADPARDAASILKPIMDGLKGTTELPSADEVAPPRGPLHPPEPAELDQDPGGGYNPDGTYPQT
jgi:hypothetical protein